MPESPGYAFGRFRLLPSQQLLLRDETPVSLTPKAFDTLVALVERRDRVVSREELLDHLWPGIAVEDGNLTQQVFLLRKALDESETSEQYIATVPRRGYRFVMDVVPLESAAHTTDRRPRRWTRIALAGAAVLLAAAGLWLLRSVVRETGLTDEHRVVVLPFSYQGAEGPSYLGEAMVDLLSRTLDGAGPLHTVDPRAVMGVLAQQRKALRLAPGGRGIAGADSTEARAVAKRLNASRYVMGEVSEADGRIRISARFYEVASTAETVRAAVNGLGSDLHALVDDLTAQLAVGGSAGPAAQLSRTASRTTSSIEALKAFLQGEQLFREPASRRPAAYDAFSRAVELDPAFAIAWYRRSQLAYFAGTALARVVEFAETAARHSANLPWRERRLIEAYAAHIRGAARQSEAAYREILQTYPDDIDALFGVTALGFDAGWLLGKPVNSYRRELDAFLRYLPDDFMGQWTLFNTEVRMGHCEQAASLADRSFPDDEPQTTVAIFCGPASQRQDDLLRSARDWPLGLLRTVRLNVNGIAANPAAAAAFARILEEREELPRFRAANHLVLAELELALGHRAEAHRQFARLATLDANWAIADEAYRMLASHHTVGNEELHAWRDRLQRWQPPTLSVTNAQEKGPMFIRDRHDGLHEHLRRYLLGRIATRLHDYDDALRLAGEIAALPGPRGRGSVAQDLAQSIRGHVLAEQGRLEEALHALDAAPREVPFDRRFSSWAFVQPEERFLRADLLSRLGRKEEALAWFQSIHYSPESVVAGPSHLRQAELLEQLGRPQEAAVQYRRFLDLWQTCDPEFRPMTHAAEAALRRLRPDTMSTVR